MRTYYDVLGVAADTPDVVVKAAFRALAKEYHPDGTGAEPADIEKFIEIQTAYSVLSKPETRSEYDAELREAVMPRRRWRFEGELASGETWICARSAADIERICARLGLYSEALAQSFHEAYLRGECGEDPARFAEEMEKSFFREYFGDDADVQALARLLLLGSRTGAALTLNQLMAGGMSSPVKDIKSILTLILDQHFPDEALFTEWLKVKFGVMPVATATRASWRKDPARRAVEAAPGSSASGRSAPKPAVAGRSSARPVSCSCGPSLFTLGCSRPWPLMP